MSPTGTKVHERVTRLGSWTFIVWPLRPTAGLRLVAYVPHWIVIDRKFIGHFYSTPNKDLPGTSGDSIVSSLTGNHKASRLFCLHGALGMIDPGQCVPCQSWQSCIAYYNGKTGVKLKPRHKRGFCFLRKGVLWLLGNCRIVGQMQPGPRRCAGIIWSEQSSWSRHEWSERAVCSNTIHAVMWIVHVSMTGSLQYRRRTGLMPLRKGVREEWANLTNGLAIIKPLP